MLEAATAHSLAQGWSQSNYISLGCCWVVRRHEIEYLNPALEGDRLVMRTWVSTMDRVASERRYEMVRLSDGKILAKAATLWVWIEMKTGRPLRIPSEVAAAFDVIPAEKALPGAR
jgi:acyl-CoA thioester hydrolase